MSFEHKSEFKAMVFSKQVVNSMSFNPATSFILHYPMRSF